MMVLDCRPDSSGKGGEITAAEATTGAHFILRFTADDDSVAYSMIELHCTQQTRCPPPCCVRLRMPLRKHFPPPQSEIMTA